MAAIDTSEFRIRPGSHFREKDAQIIGPVLVALAEQHDGELAPDDVVTAAKPAKSPIHKYFEWDNQTAADAYRRDQARHMLRGIEVKITMAGSDTPSYGRAFVNISVPGTEPEAPGEPRYIPLSDAVQNAEYLAQLVAKAEGQLRSWSNQLRLYRTLEPVRARLGRVLDAVDELETASA